MILSQCRDWLSALDAVARRKTPRLAKLAAALDGGQGLLWEGALDSEGPQSEVALRCRGVEGHASFLARAGRLLGASWRGAPPPASSPWLSLRWDAGADRAQAAWAFTAGREGAQAAALALDGSLASVSAAPCTPELARARPLRELFGEFPRHCPISEVVSGWTAGADGARAPLPRWSVRLVSPVSWPRFLALDFSKPFTARATELSYLALNRRVSELEFEGARMTAYLRA